MPLLLALLVAAANAQDPHRFEIGSETGHVVGDLKFTLVVRAVDAGGDTVTGFRGPVEIHGLEGGLRTVVLEGGVVKLKGVRLAGDGVTVEPAFAGEPWKPRVIPGWLSILPAVLAIALAIVTRQVLVALLAGIWVGVWIVHGSPFVALLRTFDAHLVASLTDADNVTIVLFTLALGGMVGVISRSGGARALVEAISRRARTRRSGMLATWGMGLAVFFDDYANCMLVGNTIRPFTDSKRISREKLAFLVDATAAPVAGIALISTWVGAEVGMIGDTAEIGTQGAYAAFLGSLPYRFYSILMLFFVFLVAYRQRDFGPMLRAERRALSTGQLVREGASPLADRGLTEMAVPEGRTLTPWNAILPVLSVIAIVIVTILATGMQAAGPGASIQKIVSNGSSYAALLYGAFGGSLMAIVAALATRVLNLRDSMDAWLTGAKGMVLAVLILALAWTLGALCKGGYLRTGDWVVSMVDAPPALLPVIVFLVSCLIAFATGTSWGTMAIVIPVAVAMAWGTTEAGDPVRYATLGAVLTGAVFGDHVSPLSDTTVMSSMAAGSDHVDHVRTQAPYALVCAGVAALVGFIPAGLGVPWWISLPAGAAALWAVLQFLGKPVEEAEATP